jgi:hypothetical protein
MPRCFCALAVFLLALPCPAAFSQDAWTQPKVKIRGTVLTSEGKPAAGAKVVIHENYDYKETASGQTDAQGKYELEAPATGLTMLTAYTSDLREAHTLTLPQHLLRTSPEHNVELQPNKFIACKFMDRSGKPVEGVIACTSSLSHLPEVKSDSRGLAHVPIKNEWLKYAKITGWTAKQGVFAAAPDALKSALTGSSNEVLVLQEVANKKPLKVKVIDENDRPAPGVRILTNVELPDGTTALTQYIKGAAQVTDENGETTFEWFPEHKMAWAHVYEPKWKEDGFVRPKSDDEPFITRVVSRVTVDGQVRKIDGVDLTGMLVTGFAYSLDQYNTGDVWAARCDREGRFRLSIAAQHMLFTTLQDRDFVSNYAEVLSPTSGHSAPTELELTPTKGVLVRVAVNGYDKQGKSPEVSLGRNGIWTNPKTKNKRGYGSLLSIEQPCDEQGVAEFRVFPGRYSTRTSLGEWSQDKTIDVKDETVELAVRPPQLETRTVQGKLLADASLLKSLAGKLEVKAIHVIDPANEGGENEEPPSSEIVSTSVAPDGTFSLQIAGDWACVVIKTADQKWFTADVIHWGDKPTEIKLHPAATYSGILLDGNNKPLANTEIELALKPAPQLFSSSITTDADGKFAYPSVPSNSGLNLRIQSTRTYLSRAFDPGEARTNVKLSTKPYTRPPLPPLDSAKALAERIASVTFDAQALYAPTLIILEGPEAPTKKYVEEFLLGSDSNTIIFEYFPYRFGTHRLANQELADWIKEQLWNIPKAGEISLIILDDKGKLREQSLFPVSGDAAAQEEVLTFLKKHALPKRNALTGLEATLAKAKKEGKRVLIKHSGTRCYPCTLLSRWLHQHHELLDKDYLHFDFDWSRDIGGIELAQKIGADKEGIPFWAILDDNGDILITSKGLTGNVGMPSGLEAKRHVRKMLSPTAKSLTKNQIESLISTLGDDE